MEVFNRITKAANVKPGILHLKISDAEAVNAWMCTNGVLEITANALVFTSEDIDMLAGVIGHEVAHWTLGHVRDGQAIDRSMAKNRLEEIAADYEGFKFMYKAGYNQCDYVKYDKKMFETYGESGGVTHPYTSQRILNMTCKGKK
jgi:predicted Zn-dependent protease